MPLPNAPTDRDSARAFRPPSADFLRVLVASDIRFYCEGLRSILAREDGVEVVGTAGDATSTLDKVRELEPDVLLIDMAMTGSLDVVRRVRDAGCSLIVALALPETESTFLPCAEAGVCAYVPRGASVAELVRALRSAAHGEPIIAPRLAGSLVRRVFSLSERQDSPQGQYELTRREAEIAELLAQGKTNKRIAADLQVELATVKNHVHNVLRKMNLSRRAEVAMRLARQRSADLPDLRKRRWLDHLATQNGATDGRVER